MINSAATTKSSSDFLTTTVSDFKISSPFTTFTTLNNKNNKNDDNVDNEENDDEEEEEDNYDKSNKTEQTTIRSNNTLNKNKFFNIKSQRKSDYNLNILDSELVTFRKNFYHHIPKRRPTIHTKTMDTGSGQQNQSMQQQHTQTSAAAASINFSANTFPSTSQSSSLLSGNRIPISTTTSNSVASGSVGVGGGSTINYQSSQKVLNTPNLNAYTLSLQQQHQQQNSQLLQQQQQLQSKKFYQNEKEAVDRYVWEMWMRTPNTTPASTVLNSPDLTEVEPTPKSYQPNQHHHHHHHQIKVGRSPVGGQYEQPDSPTMNTMPSAQSSSRNIRASGGVDDDSGDHDDEDGDRGASGEMVVFDDIEGTWRRSNTIVSPNENFDGRDHISGGHRYEDGGCYEMTHDFNGLEYGTCTENGRGSSASQITKMIGALPINDYEGSPRRIGNMHQHGDGDSIANSMQSIAARSGYRSQLGGASPFPRPGFPKRVITDAPSEHQRQSSSYQADNQHNEIGQSYEVINKKGSNYLDGGGGGGTTTKESTFDYLYEFSETRKVLEEFFKCPNDDDKNKLMSDSEGGGSYVDLQQIDNNTSSDVQQTAFIGQKLPKLPKEEFSMLESPRPSGLYNNMLNENYDNNEIELYLDSGSRSSGELADTELETHNRRHSRNFTLSPETTDYDSNCGDLDSLSNDVNGGGMENFVRLYTSMPVLEDGLSSGHASDTENNNPINPVSLVFGGERKVYENTVVQPQSALVISNQSKILTNNRLESPNRMPIPGMAQRHNDHQSFRHHTVDNNVNNSLAVETTNVTNLPAMNKTEHEMYTTTMSCLTQSVGVTSPPPPAPNPHRNLFEVGKNGGGAEDVQAALKDIKSTLTRTQKITNDIKTATQTMNSNNHDGRDQQLNVETSPIWIPRNENSMSHESLDSADPSKLISCDEEEADTDLETDRLLGQQRLDDQGYGDSEKNWSVPKSLRPQRIKSPTSCSRSPNVPITFSNTTVRASNTNTAAATPNPNDLAICSVVDDGGNDNSGEKSPTNSNKSVKGDKTGKTRNKEGLHDPAVLIEGVLFRARYLGSTQLVCEGQPTKTTRMMQAEEAVSRIKAPEGESQPSTEVDLFISTEKIMVLNTDLKEIMMDHALRTISYIADIGDLVVLMARRRFVPTEMDDGNASLKPNRTPKMICHVFESEEAQFIAQSIGQAFQVAYMEFLKANGIEDHSFVKEMDYQEVLNSQEIFGDELEIFAKKELQKEVVVPKTKGEILGVVIVESGWGSMLPTVVIANLLSSGAAARCGQLNIGDQIIAINGLSLVGLPLSTCQSYIRNAKNQTAVKFTVVPCPPVVEVKIKRPNTKYQLGFSVQNGVICSLLRGGIAERGGVRVGHRIIEINNQSVVAVPHEKIVNLLATSVGEILMKTMPTSMFRLLTGQENPIFI